MTETLHLSLFPSPCTYGVAVPGHIVSGLGAVHR